MLTRSRKLKRKKKSHTFMKNKVTRVDGVAVLMSELGKRQRNQ